MARIFLSPPEPGVDDLGFIESALASGWIAPLGPDVNAFEREVANVVDSNHAVALSSGTAALHLALMLLGVGPGDEVIVSDLTFVAAANAVCYVGARPVFVDCDPTSWTIDPHLVEAEVIRQAERGALPRAAIVVDLYGQPADFDSLRGICRQYGVPIVEDAAEALGAFYRGDPCGSLGDIGVLSFNGNKIITTSGGGMLLVPEAAQADRARYLAAQARLPTVHYEHEELGFNYRMSNVLAALGRSQLRDLQRRIDRRRAINRSYCDRLKDVPGLGFMPTPAYAEPNYWLTIITIDPSRFGVGREAVCEHLGSLEIEARPAWKPMHLQALFAGARVIGGEVGGRVFERGLCLPSGSGMLDQDVDRVVRAMLSVPGRVR